MARKNDILSIFAGTVEEIKEAGLFKGEAPIASAQGARVRLEDGREVINMCANNYLGLGDSPRLIEAAKRTYDERGYGMASVRFICGTQDIHKQLEERISRFLGMDDAILYSSCFDANGGLFETLLGPEDAVISDELNHASIIDGVRLCKAKRLRYKNNDMDDLREKLFEGCRSAWGQHQADRHRRRVLHGWLHRQPAGHLRPGRRIRRPGDGGRQPRSWLYGRAWPRHTGILRRDGPCGYHHRHPGQGPGRRLRRLHQRPPGDRGPAAPAKPPLPVLQHPGPGHCAPPAAKCSTC